VIKLVVNPVAPAFIALLEELMMYTNVLTAPTPQRLLLLTAQCAQLESNAAIKPLPVLPVEQANGVLVA
jgi:hypothetical protein